MSKTEIEKIFNKFFQPVYRYVFYRTRNIADSEDITSQTFMKIITKIDNFDGRHLSAWIFTITRNTLIDYYRQQKKQTIPLDEKQINSNDNLENKFDYNLTLKKVFKIIDSFSQTQKEIVLLRYQAGLKNKEIAAMLNINPKVVATNISRTKKYLKNNIKNI